MKKKKIKLRMRVVGANSRYNTCTCIIYANAMDVYAQVFACYLIVCRVKYPVMNMGDEYFVHCIFYALMLGVFVLFPPER